MGRALPTWRFTFPARPFPLLLLGALLAGGLLAGGFPRGLFGLRTCEYPGAAKRTTSRNATQETIDWMDRRLSR